MTRRRGERDRSVYDDIHTVFQDLPCTVRGFCYHDDDGNAFIVINARMSRAQQKQTFRHELRHIRTGQLYDPAYREYE